MFEAGSAVRDAFLGDRLEGRWTHRRRWHSRKPGMPSTSFLVLLSGRITADIFGYMFFHGSDRSTRGCTMPARPVSFTGRFTAPFPIPVSLVCLPRISHIFILGDEKPPPGSFSCSFRFVIRVAGLMGTFAVASSGAVVGRGAPWCGRWLRSLMRIWMEQAAASRRIPVSQLAWGGRGRCDFTGMDAGLIGDPAPGAM